MSDAAAAKRSAEAWGAHRGLELINEMRDLAFDHAAEFDVNPDAYLAIALRSTVRSLDRNRPKRGCA